ncbi:MAG: hypothetical protein QXL88_01235 [Candidatus Pacearchaeota archaeon]
MTKKKCKAIESALLIILIFSLILNGCTRGNILVLKDKMQIPQEKCKLLDKYVFIYETGCPHCARILPEIEKLEREKGLTFKRYNVAFEKDLRELQALGILPQGVPCVIVNCKVFIGSGYKAEDFEKAIS